MKTKYKILKGFKHKRKAQKYMDELIVRCGQYFDGNVGQIELFSLYERTWFERDKKRFYIRQLVRKGAKEC